VSEEAEVGDGELVTRRNGRNGKVLAVQNFGILMVVGFEARGARYIAEP
jgi:hypothetical protein